MDALPAVFHAAEVPAAVFDMLCHHIQVSDLVLRYLVHSGKERTGDVHCVTFSPFGEPFSNSIVMFPGSIYSSASVTVFFLHQLYLFDSQHTVRNIPTILSSVISGYFFLHTSRYLFSSSSASFECGIEGYLYLFAII